jgi:hypothetical protein
LQRPVEIKSAQQQRRLTVLFEALSDAGREMLLEYAEFLAGRHALPMSLLEPLDILRPETETVVAAIKRLVETFPMLERSALFHETSGLMAQHMMYAHPAPGIIDQLEVLFQRHYAALVERRNTDPV